MMRYFPFVFFVGCYADSKFTPPAPQQDPTKDVDPTDLDGDGYTGSEDCDDQNPLIYVGAQEICDGIDNDCDDVIDNGVLLTLFIDGDQDGFGDPNNSIESCTFENGYVENSDDCDDSSISIHPNATEICDELDNNCDGTIDEDTAFDVYTWYADNDNDSFGDPDLSTQSCSQPNGYVDNADDCDDGNDIINPNAIEVCDGVDNNCDEAIDDNASDTTIWYADTDNDTFGDPNNTTETCAQPAGHVINGDDCDDGNGNIHPNAGEFCDSIDNNCDGTIDESTASDATTWYADSDNDTFGDLNSTQNSCAQPTGYVDNTDDCDDGNNTINPNATEVCDNIDNDCDGTIDGSTAIDAMTWYADTDNDSFGDPNSTQNACAQPTGHIANNDDCDDGLSTINPNATELCDGIDNNCDGTIDEDSAYDATTWYADTDNDSFGDPNNTQDSCSQPTGYVTNTNDCDDSTSTISPDAEEVCDLVDNNCDGTIDEDQYGLGEQCAGISCDDILGEEPASPNGVYWIDPLGTGSFEAYCNMTINGGGWTLLLKTDGSYNTDFYYSDPKWTNDTLHNETSLDTSITNAKLESFVSVDIQELYGCFPSQGNHCIYLDTGSTHTAQEIFSGGFINANNEFGVQMYSGWFYQNHCKLFGVNTNNDAAKARFGFSANNEGNCDSNDTAIGFGLGYENHWAISANFSSGNYCNYSGSCGSLVGAPVGFEGYLWGR